MRAVLRMLPVALLGVLLPVAAQAATLYLDPATASYGPGDTFMATVRVDTQGQCINAARVEISYPPDELRAIDFATGNSIFSLWVDQPSIDATNGLITFSGGIPGGYCGQIPGDSTQSNALGEIIFTVLKTNASEAAVTVAPSSVAYLNDGLGTKAQLSFKSAAYALVPTPMQSSNPWVQELQNDTTPPEPFTVQVESTEGVFGGAYYAVFSTVDKQSGIDHYEANINGAWIPVTSPYKLPDQFLTAPVQIRAIDKAGNIRVGTYNASSTPLHAVGGDTVLTVVLLLFLFLLLGIALRWRRHLGFGPSGPPRP